MLMVAFILPCWEKQEVVGGFFHRALGSTWDNTYIYVFQPVFTCSFLESASPHCIHVYCMQSILNTSDTCSLFSLLPQNLILPRSAFLPLLVRYIWVLCCVAYGLSSTILCPLFYLPMPAPLCVASCAPAWESSAILCCDAIPLPCLIAPASSIFHSLQNTCLLLLSVQALRLCTKISHLVNRKIDGTAKLAAAKPQADAARA